MTFTGKITQISKDFETKGILVTLLLDDVPVQELQELKRHDSISVSIRKWREKRSKDANAYFHVLVGKLADCIGISKARCKNILITRYGQPDFIGEKPVVIKTNIPIVDMLEQEMLHCIACGCEIQNGDEIIFYRVFRGSHTYNTKEMSLLIDGTVMECKEQGIETLPPAEIERMMAAYEKKHSN